jgi:hypothetical protein
LSSEAQHFTPHLGYTYAKGFERQVLILQFTLALLILAPTVILGPTFFRMWIFAISLAGLTILYVRAAHFLALRSHIHQRGFVAYQKLRALFGLLIFLDVLVLLAAIAESGGFSNSHLGFTLLLLPIMVAFIRSGGTTALCTAAASCALIAAELVAERTEIKVLSPSHITLDIMDPVLSYFVQLSHDPASASPQFHVLNALEIAICIT